MSKRVRSYLLDANIFMRYLAEDGTEKQIEQATEIFQAVHRQEIQAVIHSLVLHEVIDVLLHVYKQPKGKIVKALKTILKLENLSPIDVSKKTIKEALHLFSTHNVDFPDCLYASLVKNQKLNLLSFDKDFSKLKIKRQTSI